LTIKPWARMIADNPRRVEIALREGKAAFKNHLTRSGLRMAKA